MLLLLYLVSLQISLTRFDSNTFRSLPAQFAVLFETHKKKTQTLFLKMV